MSVIDEPLTLDMFHVSQYADMYNSGFESGSHWDASWIPGGPHIYYPTRRDNPEQHAKAAESKLRNTEWLRGWYDGLKVRLNDTAFAEWWATNKGYSHKRYTAKNS